RFLAQQDIWITGFIKSPLFIEEIKQKENIAHTISYLPERIRNAISIRLRQKTSPEIYGLYQAILIGDRSAVSQTHLESFKASGVFHILAISGLHLSVIGALLYLTFYKILSISERLLLAFSVRKIALLLTVPPLIIYALLAGMNSPVLRALLMSIITVLAVCNNRIKTFLPLISGAAFVILLYNPHQLRTTSFQLSFCAVTGILLFLPKLVSTFEKQSEQEKKYTTKIYTYLFSAIAVSVVATLSVLPINLVAFNRISVIGPISNLLVEPLICLWALPLGLLSLPLVFLDYSLAEQLLQLGGIGIKAALHVTTFFSELPFSSVWLPTPPLWLVAIYYGALLCLLTIQNVTVSHKRIAILLILLFWVLTKYQHKIIRPTQNQITFLDVGQGSSTIIETRQGNIYIVDGGGSSFSATTIGERVIGPYLWDKGVDQIDTIFITHPDNDHFNGVPFLYEHFHPAQIVIRNQFEPKESYRHFLNNSVTQATRVTVGQTGNIIHSQDYSFTINLVKNFSQNSHGDSHTNRSEINRGLVLKTCFQQRCLILPGDIDKTAEQELLANKTIGQSTFLLAAHHGSNTSNSREFIEQIAPESIFISAGKNSRYFPGKELLELGKKAKIPLYNTGNLGTLELEFDDEGVGLYRYRKFENNPLHERKRDLLHYYPFKAQQVSERTSTPQ
ncbi:MAG: DNA internalization-related competence protein ComEC/Rec2, partial [Desulfobacterales bacterium]